MPITAALPPSLFVRNENGSTVWTVSIETDKGTAYRVVGEFQVNLKERMASIDANLEDVQAGAEACSRAADTLIADTGKFNGLLKGPLLRAVTQHVKEIRACARDQRASLQELRTSVARLREELPVGKRSAIRPPPLRTTEHKSE
jgi:hypothetical protein